MKQKIKVRLDFRSSLLLSTELSKEIEANEIIFDFSEVGVVEPFALLMVSSQIRRFQLRFPDKKIDFEGMKDCSYARHMGFFSAFNLEKNESNYGANSGDRYIPITILNCQNIVDTAYENGLEIGDQVDADCQKMARVLSKSNEGDLFDYLTYSLRELMRNVVEHSDSSQLGYCAQYWPSKSKVELAIIDRGMGIRESIRSNPFIDAVDDKCGINYALMPAVSGKAYKGSPKQHGNWANSGFGLYMTNRICRNGGSFFIASGKTGMLLTDKGEGKRYFDCDFKGTAVRMIIKTEKIGSLKDSLGRYKNEGYQIQKEYRELVKLDPSAASLMLTQDFSVPVLQKLINVIRGKN